MGTRDVGRPDSTGWSGRFETVFLARHGETEWNLLGRRQGQLDSPLSARGVLQGRQIAAVAAASRVDGVFASPLGRAVSTATQCAEPLGLPVLVIDELAEVDHGEMAGLTSAEIERAYPDEMDRRAAGKYEWCFPGGESYADADRRAASALDQIAATIARRPLIVSHEMIGRLIRRRLLGVDPVTALTWHHPHDVIFAIDPVDRTLSALATDQLSDDRDSR